MKSKVRMVGKKEKNNKNKYAIDENKNASENVYTLPISERESVIMGTENNKWDINDAKFGKEIINLIIKTGEVSCNVGKDTILEEVDLDSITFITIIVELEKKYKIEFDDEKMLVSNYKTIGDLIEYVKMKVAKLN